MWRSRRPTERNGSTTVADGCTEVSGLAEMAIAEKQCRGQLTQTRGESRIIRVPLGGDLHAPTTNLGCGFQVGDRSGALGPHAQRAAEIAREGLSIERCRRAFNTGLQQCDRLIENGSVVDESGVQQQRPRVLWGSQRWIAWRHRLRPGLLPRGRL